MGLFETLDRILCGEEVLNKWAKEREDFKNGKFLTLDEQIKQQKEKQELNFIKEFYKLGNGNLYSIEELPEIFKRAIIVECGSLEKEKLKNHVGYAGYSNNPSEKYVRGRIPLFSEDFDWGVFVGNKGMKQYGFYYVENDKGEFRLKTYQERRTQSMRVEGYD